MVASYRVMVSNGASQLVEQVRGGDFDRPTLINQPTLVAGRMEGEVGCGPIWINVRESAGDQARLAGHLSNGLLGGRFHSCVKMRESVPGNRGLEGLDDDTARCQDLATVRHADECIAPLSRRTFALGGLAARRLRVEFAAVGPHD